MLESKTFIIAVSGGLDSVVLLNKLVLKNRSNSPKIRYIVAHIDHQIRPDSSQDAQFVAKLAEQYVLEYRQKKLQNPPKDEDGLRKLRYQFLFDLKQEYQAEAILTAHHQDDLLETMILNILRGTSPRGLSPMNRPGILRPLLNTTKRDLLEYAQKNNLQWREDSTNADQNYLRNYIRHQIIPKLQPVRQDLLTIQKNLSDIYADIDARVSLFTPENNLIHRLQFVNYPRGVAREIIRAWLIKNSVTEIDSKLLERVFLAIKTLPIGKKIDINNQYWLVSAPEILILNKK